MDNKSNYYIMFSNLLDNPNGSNDPNSNKVEKINNDATNNDTNDTNDTNNTIKKYVSKNADNIPLLNLYQHLDIEVRDWDTQLQNQWFMPEDYCPNLVEMLYGMCKTKEQTDRVSLELELFIQHNMMDLLFYLKYLVDTLRQNKIVWGVGRGSSVASYILFLIGVHKIDSIKYDLDIKEFLK
jgi:DNA polymerase III alpha subunit